jgi:hypothetical protein
MPGRTCRGQPAHDRQSRTGSLSPVSRDSQARVGPGSALASRPLRLQNRIAVTRGYRHQHHPAVQPLIELVHQSGLATSPGLERGMCSLVASRTSRPARDLSTRPPAVISAIDGLLAGLQQPALPAGDGHRKAQARSRFSAGRCTGKVHRSGHLRVTPPAGEVRRAPSERLHPVGRERS